MPATILHDNGRGRMWVDRKRLVPNLGPVYCRMIEREVLARPGISPGGVDTPDDLDVVLCSTRSKKQYTEHLLDAQGIVGYSVLGRHLPEWKHIHKIQLILEHIDSHPKPELLLHLDATDVLVVGELRSAVNAFLKTSSCGLLFGAEKNSAPGSSTTNGITAVERQLIETIEDFEKSTYSRPFLHLNAGCFIGRKTAIRELFTKAMLLQQALPITTVLHNGNSLVDDDQLVLRELHRFHYPRVQIDHRSLVFQNLFAIRRRELAVNRGIPRGPGFAVECMRHFVSLFMSRARRALHGRS